MIRGAIVHVINEQPLRVDLREMPSATDGCLVCTNVRLLNGRRPAFVDDTDSWVLVPLQHVRFVEIPASSVGGAEGEARVAAAEETTGEAEPELGLDEELLRRIRET
jgi:hypothetical protein